MIEEAPATYRHECLHNSPAHCKEFDSQYCPIRWRRGEATYPTVPAKIGASASGSLMSARALSDRSCRTILLMREA